MHVRIPESDLVAELRNLPDPSLGDRENVCCALPRHLRLFVAGFMLATGDSSAECREGMRRARDLYEWSGRDLLNDKRRLTTASIVAEVLQLVSQLPSTEVHDE